MEETIVLQTLAEGCKVSTWIPYRQLVGLRVLIFLSKSMYWESMFKLHQGNWSHTAMWVGHLNLTGNERLVFCIFTQTGSYSGIEKKKSVSALSWTEAEVIAGTEAASEFSCMLSLVTWLTITKKWRHFFCDSQLDIEIAHTAGNNGRIKHLDGEFQVYWRLCY